MQTWHAHKPTSFPMRGRWVFNWFSNMLDSEITIDGITYRSVENYFQAQKITDLEVRLAMSQIDPHFSKKVGREIDLREDWNDIRYEVMKTGLRAKFSKPEWKEKLLLTGTDTIIEWNNWNDKSWGVSIYDCEGDNLLGKALMEIRNELR